MPISSRSLRAGAHRQVRLVDHDDGRGPVPEKPVLPFLGVRDVAHVDALLRQAKAVKKDPRSDAEVRSFCEGVLITLGWLMDPSIQRPWLVDLEGKSD
ncbi:MAG TPA: hypothetical protein VIV12_26525 [Streptosporangiaceae bacterium]